MRIQVLMKLSKNQIAVDWRRMMLSFIKMVLKKECPQVYEEYYKSGTTKMKPFTFWAVLPKSNFNGGIIELENNQIALCISTNQTKLAFIFYNGFSSLKNKQILIQDENKLTFKTVNLLKEKEIVTNEIVVKMLSPLVVRKHNKNNKDEYYIFNEDGFKDNLKNCIKSQISEYDDVPEIQTVKGKKLIAKAYGIKIPTNLGIFKLCGEIKVLNELYTNGMGAKSSAGFGKFEIIG